MALTKAAIPVAIIAFVLCVGKKNILLDRQLSRKYNSKNNDLGVINNGYGNTFK